MIECKNVSFKYNHVLFTLISKLVCLADKYKNDLRLIYKNNNLRQYYKTAN